MTGEHDSPQPTRGTAAQEVPGPAEPAPGTAPGPRDQRIDAPAKEARDAPGIETPSPPQRSDLEGPGGHGRGAPVSGPSGAGQRGIPASGPEPPGLSRPGAGQQSAVLDESHLGDIEGALGRIRLGDDDSRRGLRRQLVTFLAIMGPGLIVMVGDNDAGGVSTYAQAGQNYGYSLLWVLLLLIPVLIVNQEMVVRLGAVTGVGHARLIIERFGKFWGAFSVGDLFVLNFLTIVTEFIGVSLALRYFGISSYISVPVTAVLLIAITASGSFARWERAIFLFIAASLVLYPLALLSGPHWGSIAYHLVVPGIQGAPPRPRSCSSSRSWAPPSHPGSCSSSSRTSSTSASRPGSSATSGPTPRSAPSSSWSGRSRSRLWPCTRSAARTWSGSSPTRSG